MVHRLLLYTMTLAFCSSLTSQESVKTSYYKSAVLTTSKPKRFNDKPTTSISMKAGSMLKCARQCLLYPACCVVHQMNNNEEQCQLYNYFPIKFNYTSTSNCNAFYGKS